MNLLLLLHGFVVLLFTLRILLRDDLSPPARLAWFVVLNVVPFVGSAIYFLFGEIDLGKKAKQARISISQNIHQSASRVKGTADDLGQMIPAQYQAVFRYGASINGFFPVAGNTAALMADGSETLDRMVADIDAAQDHVHVLYYIWLQDHTGTQLAEALIRATKRGVTCRAMADGLGSRHLIKSPLWQQMKDAGVQLAVALPLDRPFLTILTSRLDLRNHRKITVIDGSITYCGSRNSADPAFLVKAKYAPWVDIMLRFQGPVVAQNQLLFVTDWAQATGESLNTLIQPAAPFDGGFPAQALGFGPTERRGATPQLFSTALSSARDTIVLSTPYFVPDGTVLDALCTAALRGVQVTLVFPKKNDSKIVAAASKSYYLKLLEAGCEIYEYRDGLLHAKTLTIDDSLGLIGSSNLDIRSFDLNFENNILLQDTALTQMIRSRQQDYIDRSDSVSHSDVKNWPYLRRIWNNVIATVGPIL
ncbi:cardiolipin synthase [Roseobacter sp. N2S]|uniref:cardiolipin synthase n=1 Tax=Roseobacter sp. N2S TaxID=2663844 RepID=UPI00285DB0AA|nr:cardiolipin synthase [Roseobacter sp. N2S]MDR6266643.1 cardiolipin synthase [Roseobacter sp. N2S]